jgi:hypothetical protein
MVLLEDFGPACAKPLRRRQGRTLSYPFYDARHSKVKLPALKGGASREGNFILCCAP